MNTLSFNSVQNIPGACVFKQAVAGKYYIEFDCNVLTLTFEYDIPNLTEPLDIFISDGNFNRTISVKNVAHLKAILDAMNM